MISPVVADDVARAAVHQVAVLLAQRDQVEQELRAAVRLALARGGLAGLMEATGMPRSTLYRLAQVPGRDGRANRAARRAVPGASRRGR